MLTDLESSSISRCKCKIIDVELSTSDTLDVDLSTDSQLEVDASCTTEELDAALKDYIVNTNIEGANIKAVALDDTSDVEAAVKKAGIVSPQNGDMLVIVHTAKDTAGYVYLGGVWNAFGGNVTADNVLFTDDIMGGGSGTTINKLEDIEDVTLTDITDGQTLVWDSDNTIWKNKTISGGGGESSSTSNIYSYEETEVGTWVDGKALYRIVFSSLKFPQCSSNGTVVYTDIDTSGLNIDTVVNFGGTAINTANETRTIPFQAFNTTYGLQLLYSPSSNVLRICNSNKSYNNYTMGYVFIEYTKTTD